MSILVFGSLNMDLTTYAPRLPMRGETLFGSSYQLNPGGKGANQAVAAARLGSSTRMIGRVGEDEFGGQALQALSANGVDTAGVLNDPEQETGLAVISVDQAGDNTIVVISGANMALNQEDVGRALPMLHDSEVLLLQLEVPLEASLQLAKQAKKHGLRIILDPAPVQSLSEEDLAAIDILTPNENEAEALTGFPVNSVESAEKAARVLVEGGARAVVVKLGRLGAYYVSESGSGFVPAFQVAAVDSVAAGDAFNAGLAVALGEGSGLAEAVRFGAAAGALATTVKGALPSMPTREAVQALLADGTATQ